MTEGARGVRGCMDIRHRPVLSVAEEAFLHRRRDGMDHGELARCLLVEEPRRILRHRGRHPRASLRPLLGSALEAGLFAPPRHGDMAQLRVGDRGDDLVEFRRTRLVVRKGFRAMPGIQLADDGVPCLAFMDKEDGRSRPVQGPAGSPLRPFSRNFFCLSPSLRYPPCGG